MSKGGSSTTTTNNSDTNSTTSLNQVGGRQYAPWMDAAQRYGIGSAFGLAQNFIGNAPTQAVAGFNPDQLKGFDLARDMAQGAFGDGGMTTLDPSGYTARAAQLGGNDYQRFKNPFLNDVGRTVVDTQRRELENNLARAGARAANGAAFGGSGAALERAQLARGANQDAVATVAQLMSGGFDRATGLAERNVDRRQQANMQNAGNYLTAKGMEDGFRGSAFGRQQSALAQLLGIGGAQQQLTQRSLDTPFEKMSWLGQFIPSQYGYADVLGQTTNSNSRSNSTGTAPDNSPSPLQQLLGFGMTGLGEGGWLSGLFS